MRQVSARRCRRSARSRRGMTLVGTTFTLIMVIATAVFAVECGRIFVLRGQMKNAVDAGALAAALRMQQSPDNVDAALAAAREYIQRNRVGFLARVPDDSIQAQAGTWEATNRVFTPGGASPNAVRVFARQDREPFFFGRIFGRDVFGAAQASIATASGKPVDIMLVLDLSGSMASNGRIQALHNAVPTFVDVIEGMGGDDRIGVIGLSANPSTYDPARLGHSGRKYLEAGTPSNDHHVGVLEQNLTDSFGFLRNTVLAPSNLPSAKYGSWTGTGAALRAAAHYLTYGSGSRDDVDRVIVLMSDGHANKPTNDGRGYAMAQAQYARAKNIRVFTISLGNDADLALMQQIADITGATHFDATGTGEAALTERLRAAFRSAALSAKRVHLVD